MEWFTEHLWQTWLGIAIVLGMAEMFSLDLILAMLAAGAVVGMLAAVLALPFAAQVLLGAAASVAMLALVRPSLVKRLHAGPDFQVGHQKLIGQRAQVTLAITGKEAGRIRIAGEDWSAQPYDESLVIEPGQTVEIFEIRGATALVHPVAELE
ncbi:MAG: NfeD family protein [Nocardioides sp.]|mgnify:CR=1 FL=1|jgi:membrane protein implicated in regulation of membrane protease activity